MASAYLFTNPSASGFNDSFDSDDVTTDWSIDPYSLPTLVTHVAEDLKAPDSFRRIFLVESIFKTQPKTDVIEAFKLSRRYHTSLT